MRFIGSLLATLLLLTLASCNGLFHVAARPAPSGLKDTGSAGTVGGAAAAPAGVGTISKTQP